MPIPKPKIDESQKDFMNRCMGDDTMNKEYPDGKQRAAVCSTQWKNKKSSELTEGFRLQSGVEPKNEIMLFPFGEFDHPVYGKIVFDNKFALEIIKNYEEDILHTKPFMDQGHDEDKALAWFNTVPYIRQGVGVFAKPEYTDFGKQMLSDKVYQYFSPWFSEYTDPQTGKKYKNVFRGGAATNIPFLKIMPAIVEDVQLSEAVEIKLSELTDTRIDSGNGDTGNPQKSSKGDSDKYMEVNMLEKLIKLFALAENATETEVMEAIEKKLSEHKTKIDELTATITAKETELADAKKNDTKMSEHTETKKQLAEVTKKYNDLNVRFTEKERDEVISKALTDGKITPANKEHWEKRFMEAPEKVTEDIKHMVKSVEFSEVGSGAKGKDVDGDPGDQLIQLAEKKSAELNIEFDSAYAKVALENPELYKQYKAKYE